MLVCADGAPSRLATQLGIVSRPPDSSCSRSYVESGTHKFKADGVVFYNPELLPGSIFFSRRVSALLLLGKYDTVFCHFAYGFLC